MLIRISIKNCFIEWRKGNMAIHPTINDSNDLLHLQKYYKKLKKLSSWETEFFNSIPHLVLIVDVDGIILDINQALSKSLGKKKDEIIDKNILELPTNKIGLFRRTVAEQVMKNKESKSFFDTSPTRFFKTTYIPTIEQNDEYNSLIILIEDITDEKRKEKQMIEDKEKYFESLIENSLDLITVLTKEGIIIYESPSLKRILGFTPEERLHKNVFENIHPRDKKRVKDFFNQILYEPGFTKKITYKIKDKSGNWHYFESLGNNLLNNYSIKGLIVNSRDITNRITTEMEKNAILDNTSEIIAYHDLNHNLIWANKAYQQETNHSLDELVGKKCYHAWGLDKPCNQCPISKALKTGNANESVFSPNNKTNWPSYFKTWQIKAEPVLNEDGEIIGAIEISYDITKQRKANEEIKRTKDHLEKLINNTSEIIFSVNQSFIVTLWNQTAEKITGISSKKIVGKDIRKQNFIQNTAELNNFLKNQFNHKPESLNYLVLNTVFGRNRMLQVSTSIVKDEKDDITDIIFICNDKTLRDGKMSNLRFGASYLIEDTNPDHMIDLFNELLHQEQQGLFISRSYNSIVPKIRMNQVTFVLLSQKSKKQKHSIYSLDEVKDCIQDFLLINEKGIICLDRSDYLFTLFGFQNTLQTLYQINDLIRRTQSIFLLRVNNELFTRNQTEILNEEFFSLPSNQINHIYLDTDLFSILNYIYEQNQTNNFVYQKNIFNHFSISKVTTQKRISSLIDKELISFRKRGRVKNLFITEKGKQLLRKKA